MIAWISEYLGEYEWYVVSIKLRFHDSPRLRLAKSKMICAFLLYRNLRYCLLTLNNFKGEGSVKRSCLSPQLRQKKEKYNRHCGERRLQHTTKFFGVPVLTIWCIGRTVPTQIRLIRVLVWRYRSRLRLNATRLPRLWWNSGLYSVCTRSPFCGSQAITVITIGYMRSFCDAGNEPTPTVRHHTSAPVGNQGSSSCVPHGNTAG